MTDTSRNRKVRGSKIRSSRSDKRQSRGSEDKELKRLADARDTDSEQAGDRVGDAFIPDEQSFIETDAVARVTDRMRRWLSVDRPVHLIGPTGCGKTAVAMHVARTRDRPVVWVNGDADLTTSDLVGEYAETERISEHDQFIHNVVKRKDIVRDRWVDNPLTLAVQEGATLVYNEFSRTKPVANNVLLSVFEEGVLELPGKRGASRYVDVHPAFRTILTSNSVEYAGVHEPQDALLDRLVGLHMDFYDAETETAIVRAHVEAADVPVAAIVGMMRELRERLEITVGTRAAIMAAEGLTAADDPDADTVVDVCTDVLASKVSQRSDVEALRDVIEETLADRGVTLS
ncbi:MULTISPECIES: gas vesicle protein GvpN [Halobacterium]|uniref:Gas vesicle ATPase GvpN2 n=5 Tax=Halobacterium salinarum TaxID=2242 RepID=GVPN2_HALSA|nr:MULTISPECIES: gas vesicle protein GvpN [Halobacterium]Q9HHS9.1 RecName: Full=Gas vesicle ATPase GvpN2; AltName: Full=Gas vesicle protein N2; Short=GvpN2 [Halobacterium salinarum NRC-1]AAG20897.1 GvpN protein, cluster B [Halobacterium salinarum NRC-1]MBB6090593.1 gas vesicle protein GvpN [Halobacterium salinarum]MCF2207578.1 gas vesicle protein GvpN [Halobacterium salinarum]MCF2241628.1 gas vesicle protein GvpN [Halobacterium salinarum]MDL0119947.1 gas vesicle protein GvpN [Halobacterium sa